MTAIYTQLESLFKAQKWQDCINTAKTITNPQSELDNTQLIWLYWWQGQAHKNLGQYEQAEQAFQALIDKFPNHHRGYEGMVNVAQHGRNLEQIHERAMTFREKFPDMWHSYWWIGQNYKNLGQYEQAEAEFGRFMEKFPTMHQGLEGMVNVAQHQKDWQKTVERATIFQEKFPNLWHSYWWLGQAHKNLHQYKQAQGQFTQLADKFPAMHHGYQGLIEVAQQQQDWQQVIKHTKTLQAKFPNMWQGYWWQGHAYKNLRQYEQAEQQFSLLIEKFPQMHQGYEGMVNIAQHQGDQKVIIERATAFREKFPHMWQSYWWVGQSYKNQYQYAPAYAEFEKLIELSPRIHQGLEGLINVSQHENDWQKTAELSKQFIKQFPHMWQGYWWLGHAHKNLAEYEQAEQQFAHLMKAFPQNHYGIQGLIDTANHQANWQSALAWCDAGIELLPKHTSFYSQRGTALVRLKRFDEAESYFLALSKQFPDDPSPLTGLASMYYTLRKWEKSIITLQKALLHFPKQEHIARQLINSYLIYNEPEDALSIFNQYLGNHDSIANQLLLARIYQIQHGNGYYLDMLEALYEKHPEDISVAITYANALINLTLEEV